MVNITDLLWSVFRFLASKEQWVPENWHRLRFTHWHSDYNTLSCESWNLAHTKIHPLAFWLGVGHFVLWVQPAFHVGLNHTRLPGIVSHTSDNKARDVRHSVHKDRDVRYSVNKDRDVRYHVNKDRDIRYSVNKDRDVSYSVDYLIKTGTSCVPV